MKIGFLIYGSLDILSGGYLYDRKLVDYLRLRGDLVTVISLPWRNYPVHLTDNFSFRLPPGLDILIEDELNHPSLIGANLGRQGIDYPVISLVHHLRSSELRPRWQNACYRAVESRYLRSVDGFIFNSQTTRAVVTDLVGDEKPSLVAYPPTDRFGDGFSEEQARTRSLEAGPLRLLFLGNVIPRKGLHTVLKALAFQGTLPGASPGNPTITLDVVGSLAADPAYARRMRTFAASHCPPSSIVFHGALDNMPLFEKLKRAHVLVVPSSYEGFGIVYLEGMALGLPAIGTTAGAAPEIISDGETGYLIRPEDALALAQRLERLASDRVLLARLSQNALHRYHDQPRWEQTAGEVRAFLETIRGKQ